MGGGGGVKYGEKLRLWVMAKVGSKSGVFRTKKLRGFVFFSLATVAQDLPEVQLLIVNVERKGENKGV